MRLFVLPVSLFCCLAVWGCSNPCEEALTHMNECLQLEDPDTEEAPECDDTAECKAECVLDAPCEAFVDSTSAAAEAYRSCVAGC